VDGRGDLFSLGVILYALVAGDKPFLGETMTTVSYQIVHADPIPLSKLNPSVSLGLECVILKCLAKNPAERYQTGEELAQDLAALHASPNVTLAAAPGNLSQAQGQRSATEQKPASATGSQPAKSPKRALFVAAALLTVAAAAASGWFLLRLHRPQPAPQQQAIAVPAPQPAAPAPLPVVQGTVLPGETPAAPAKPMPGKPKPAKPAAATLKPATAPANPTPAYAAKPAAASAAPQSQPAAQTPAAPLAATAIDPHELNPTTNAKFKIELSHLPPGIFFTVEMNKAVYLRFVTGDMTNLDNLFVPPGIQTFRVVAQNGGQPIASNIVSSEFKAKKRKNLKIELRNQDKVPAGSPAPLSPGAQIFVSLSSPLF
jgi:serine/threonine-protein kinase